MKLTSTATTYFVEHGGLHYRTTDGKNWEVAMGESWESAYHEEDALSRMFAQLHSPIRSQRKWNKVLEALSAVYEQYHHHDDYDSFWRAVRELMQAYDEWLD